MSSPRTVVNETEARVVAAQVATLAALAIALQQPVVVAALAGDFALRLLAGPAVSPLARLARHVIVPLLKSPKRPVASAPKRFAQLLGLLFTSVSSLAGWLAEAPIVPLAAAGALVVLAGLEAVIGFCAGCFMFNGLVRLGVLSAPVCEACEDITKLSRISGESGKEHAANAES